MMAEGQQEDRGFGCGATDRNLILVLSRCGIIPKFDLFRAENLRASNQISPTGLASYPKHSWIMGTLQLLLPRPRDSRLTLHLSPLPSSLPSLLSSSSRITSSLWIWAVLLTAISSTETWTPASLAAEIRGLSCAVGPRKEFLVWQHSFEHEGRVGRVDLISAWLHQDGPQNSN